MQSLKTVHSQSLQNTVFHPQQVRTPQLLLQHGLDLLGGSLIIQMFCCVPTNKNRNKDKNSNFRELKKKHYLHWVLELSQDEQIDKSSLTIVPLIFSFNWVQVLPRLASRPAFRQKIQQLCTESQLPC